MATVPALKDDEAFHAFIAHSFVDHVLADTFTKKLEDLGFKIFLYERDLSGVIISEVTANIEKSRRVILLLTQSFLDSRWGVFEAMEAISSQNIKKKVVLIPVLYNLRPDQVPSYLRPYRYFEYQDPDFEKLLEKALVKDVMIEDLIPAGNVAFGLAWSYYYGYLNLVLPGLKERTEQWLMEQGELPEMLKKMVIIASFSCRCPDKFPEEFTHVGYINFEASRAGNVARSYKSSVYRFCDPNSEEEYLFIAEFATPLMSIWEMGAGGIAGMSQEHKVHQRMLFSQKLCQILNHPNNVRCRDETTYLEYDDKNGWEDFPRVLGQHIRQELNYAKVCSQKQRDGM